MKRKQRIINGETAIKPYYYLRNGLIHARFIVDRAIELSETEEKTIKEGFIMRPYDKQRVLEDEWNFLEKTVGKVIIHDGIKEVERRIKRGKKKWTTE